MNVPRSLEAMLAALREEGYDLGPGPLPSGEALVAALRALEEGRVMAGGVAGAEAALDRLKSGEGGGGGQGGEGQCGGEGGARLEGVSIAGADVSMAQLKKWLEFPRDWGPTEVGLSAGACHVIHPVVYRCAPRQPPHCVTPVVTTSSTPCCTGGPTSLCTGGCTPRHPQRCKPSCVCVT
jgi:hypothetical protein